MKLLYGILINIEMLGGGCPSTDFESKFSGKPFGYLNFRSLSKYSYLIAPLLFSVFQDLSM